MSKKNQKKNKPEGKKSFWKFVNDHRGLSAIVAALAVALVIAIIVLVSMKADEVVKPPKGPSIQISKDFYHEAPEGMDLKDAISLKNEKTAKDVICREGTYSLEDTPVAYDYGWYVFDNDGTARKYRDMDGKIHDLPEEEWITDINRGLELQIYGELTMHFVLYKSGENAVKCFQYFVLSDANDMDTLLEALQRCNFGEAEKVSKLVAVIECDTKKIASTLSGLSQDMTADLTFNVSLAKYIAYLEEFFGVVAE